MLWRLAFSVSSIKLIKLCAPFSKLTERDITVHFHWQFEYQNHSDLYWHLRHLWLSSIDKKLSCWICLIGNHLTLTSDCSNGTLDSRFSMCLKISIISPFPERIILVIYCHCWVPAIWSWIFSSSSSKGGFLEHKKQYLIISGHSIEIDFCINHAIFSYFILSSVFPQKCIYREIM